MTFGTFVEKRRFLYLPLSLSLSLSLALFQIFSMPNAHHFIRSSIWSVNKLVLCGRTLSSKLICRPSMISSSRISVSLFPWQRLRIKTNIENAYDSIPWVDHQLIKLTVSKNDATKNRDFAHYCPLPSHPYVYIVFASIFVVLPKKPLPFTKPELA